MRTAVGRRLSWPDGCYGCARSRRTHTLRRSAGMIRNSRFGGGLIALLGGAVAAQAQGVPQPVPSAPIPVIQAQAPAAGPEAAAPSAAAPALEPESRPSERAEEAPAAPKLGPTPVEDVKFLMDV